MSGASLGPSRRPATPTSVIIARELLHKRFQSHLPVKNRQYSLTFLGENVASEHKLSHIYKDPSLCMGRVQNGWLVLGIYHIFICPIRKLVLQDNSRRGGGKHPVKELAPGIEKPLPKMRAWIAFSNVQFCHATLGHIQLLMDL